MDSILHGFSRRLKINEAVEQEAESSMSRLRRKLERYTQECDGLRSLILLVTEEDSDPDKIKDIFSVDENLLNKTRDIILERRQQASRVLGLKKDLEDRLKVNCELCDMLNAKLADLTVEKSCLDGELDNLSKDSETPEATGEESTLLGASPSAETNDDDVICECDTANEDELLELDGHGADHAEMQRYIADITRRFRRSRAELEGHIFDLEETVETERKYFHNALKLQQVNVAKMTDMMSESEIVIQSLELELQAIRDERQMEKERQLVEMNDIKTALMQREEECCLLSDQLEETATSFDEERNNFLRLKDEMETENNAHEEQIREKDKELSIYESECVVLKKQLIKLIKEKDTWKLSDKYQQRVNVAETWMNDADVTHCLGCRKKFHLIFRKHHCRLCGRIFCNMCSDNWVLTTHSKKKLRGCNDCFIEHELGRLSPEPDALSGESLSCASDPESLLSASLECSPSPSPPDFQILSELAQNATDEVKLLCQHVNSGEMDFVIAWTEEVVTNDLPSLESNVPMDGNVWIEEVVTNDLPSLESNVPMDGNVWIEEVVTNDLPSLELNISMDGNEFFYLITDDEIPRSSSETSHSMEER